MPDYFPLSCSLCRKLFLFVAIAFFAAPLMAQAPGEETLQPPPPAPVAPVRSFDFHPKTQAESSAPSDVDGETVLHVSSREVLLMADVYDHNSLRLIPGLKLEDFHLLVDKKPAPLRSMRYVVTPGLRLPPNELFNVQSVNGSWRMRQQRPLRVQNYYLLGFKPTETAEGVCHSVQVQLADKQHDINLSPTRYCYTRSNDPLLDTPMGSTLLKAARKQGDHGNISAQMRAFYVAPNRAEAQISVNFDRLRMYQRPLGDNHFVISVHLLGLVVDAAGKQIARFSDNYDQTVYGGKGGYIDFAPLQYATDLALAPGDYQLQIAINDDLMTSNTHASLHVEAYDGRSIAVSQPTICEDVRQWGDAQNDTPQLAEIRPAPLVSHNVQCMPSGSRSFKLHEPMYAYFELYAPTLLDKDSSGAEYEIKLYNARGEVKYASERRSARRHAQPDSIVAPILQLFDFSSFGKGCYKLEVNAYVADKTARSSAEVCLVE